MSRTRRWIVALAVLSVGSGCVSNTAPRGFLADPVEAQRDVFGGWLEAEYQTAQNSQSVEGELLAASADSLWVLTDTGGRALAIASIIDGKLTGYDSESKEVSGGVLLGTVSTILNGYFFVFTAPMWIIAGSLTAGKQSRLPVSELPVLQWSVLNKFARFPAGLPTGLDLKTLTRKQNLAEGL